LPPGRSSRTWTATRLPDTSLISYLVFFTAGLGLAGHSPLLLRVLTTSSCLHPA
jgi:hypothetical protein